VSLEGLSQSSRVAKNTIRRHLEYLEAAFLIKRVEERIDQNAKRFKRAMCFKVYLTNPSMRAALFGQLDIEAEAMGALTETAIFSQWQNNQQIELYYARWNTGEIDIVHLHVANQKPAWAVLRSSGVIARISRGENWIITSISLGAIHKLNNRS